MIDVSSGEIVNVGSETVTNGVEGLLTATTDMSKNMFDGSGNSSNGNNPSSPPVNPSHAPDNHSSTAYLNYMDVATAMPEYKQMQTSLKNSQDESQAQLKAMSDEYTQKLSDYVAQQDNLNESIKIRRQQELQNLQQRAQDFQQSAAQKQDALQQRLLAPIQEKLQNAINEIGKENNFLYITNSTACRYVSPGATDATPLVKKKLGIQTIPDNNPTSISNNLSITAYLNSMDVVKAMPEFMQMQTSLKNSQDEVQSQLKAISDEYTKKLSDYVSQQDNLDATTKSRRQQELQDLRQRAENLQQTAAQQQDALQQRLSAPIQDKLQNAINNVGSEKQFLYIIDSQIFLYVSPNATDATSLVKKELGIQSTIDNNPVTSYNPSSAAYLNYNDIVTAMPEYKQMQSSLKNSQDESQAELKAMSDEYTKKLSDYVSQQDNLSESIKTIKQQELQNLQQRAENFQQSSAQKQDALQQQLSAPIQDKLQKAINDVGRENNFIYIANSQAYVYISPSASDATSLVKRKLGI